MIRDHEAVIIDTFNGLWKRGDSYNTPLDHFETATNIKFTGSNSFATRDGIGNVQAVASVTPLTNIVRIYNYPLSTGNTLIALVIDGTDGKIYHIVSNTVVYGPILTITGMKDFAFVPYAGRAYISPIAYYTQGDLNIERGMQSQFLYVYDGAGNNARKAAGATPAGTVTPSNGAAGYTDPGFRVFAVVGETDSGFLSAPFAFATFTTVAAGSVTFTTIPILTGAQWTKRHIVATKVIASYNGNTSGYEFFFIPGATVNDNTTTTLSNRSFFDLDLLDDASHLLDNYAEIPAGACLALYHNRLCLGATYTDESVVLISAVGEPEAIDQIVGLVVVPPDGNPITNVQELRDVLYVFKRAKTVAFVDNNDDPSTWEDSIIDNALGSCLHGVATVLDSGASTVDYLMIANFAGIVIFNGRFIRPELSWKIYDFWLDLDRDEFRKIQVVYSPIKNEIYCVLPNNTVLVGNTANGLDPKNIRWAIWTFDAHISSLAIRNIDDIILGAQTSAN